MNITHTYDADLDICLKSPNGSQIELVNGKVEVVIILPTQYCITGGGAITSGSAPFTGNYAPEQAFSGLSGSANGTWNLVVVDDVKFDWEHY